MVSEQSIISMKRCRLCKKRDNGLHQLFLQRCDILGVIPLVSLSVNQITVGPAEQSLDVAFGPPPVQHVQMRNPVQGRLHLFSSFLGPVGTLKMKIPRSLRLVEYLFNLKPPKSGRNTPFNDIALRVSEDGCPNWG